MMIKEKGTNKKKKWNKKIKEDKKSKGDNKINKIKLKMKKLQTLSQSKEAEDSA